MDGTRTEQRPPRTRAVAALDLVLGAPAALRRLMLALVRATADPRAGRLMTRGIIAAAVAVVVGTGLVVAVLLRAPDGFAPMGIGPEPGAEVATPSGPGRAGIGPNYSPASASPRAPAPTSTASAVPPPATPDASAVLTAAYSTEQRTLVGYRAALAIANPGNARAQGWTVVVTLPRRTLSVAEVRGATVTQDGAAWTFLPDRDTSSVPAGGMVRVTFRVDGAVLGSTAPTGCTVNGRPCGGEFSATR